MKLYTPVAVICFHLCCYLNIYSQDFSTAYPNNRSVADTTIAPFYHGVASGDPLSDRVIIWTRVTSNDIFDTVYWYVATDSTMENIISKGKYFTSANKDHTVKIDVTGLTANTYYYYTFYSKGRFSQVGRTKTMPVGEVNNLRIGVLSCSNYSFGYFNAYDILNERNDVDFIMHLGDYIYEDGYHNDGIDTLHRRVFPEYDAYDKPSYEMRYSWYRLDPSLRELHRQYPWVVIWDDHEFANDAFRDTSFQHHPLTQGTWADRKKAAIEAFKEWIPFREDTAKCNIINYTQHIGNLADIIYTENRIQRDTFDNSLQFLSLLIGTNNPLSYAKPNLSALGSKQLNWICNELKTSDAKWKILANQLAFTPFFIKGPLQLKSRFPSSWDFYPWDRKHILDTVAKNNIKNFVVLSADAHVAMAFDVVHDSIPYSASNGTGSLGVEFVCDNAVYGNFFSGMEPFMFQYNPQLKYLNTNSQGFYILDIKPSRMCCDYWQIDSINTLNTKKTYLKTFCTEDNMCHLKEEVGPIPPVNTYAPLLSYHVNTAITITGVPLVYGNIEVLKLYPNPTKNYINIQFSNLETNNVQVFLYDMTGRMLQEVNLGLKIKGLNSCTIHFPNFASGQYILDFVSEGIHNQNKIIIE